MAASFWAARGSRGQMRSGNLQRGMGSLATRLEYFEEDGRALGMWPTEEPGANGLELLVGHPA